MENVEAKLVEIITQLQGLAEPAADLTLRAIQAGAIVDLALALVALPLIYGGYRLAAWLFVRCRNADGDDDVVYGLGGALTTVVTAITGICSLVVILSTSTWLAVFAPELYLARQIIKSVAE